MDNPVQVERSTGLGNHLDRNCVAVQQRKFIFAVIVLNCYAVRWWVVLCTPVLHFVCTGLSMLKSYGLGNRKQIITFILILRERLHYAKVYENFGFIP
ncbi:MAG: hypothetical protein LBL39_07315 [Planctomycetaceae bacterium]|jgi:hypothetical protein|nr:hypothetical protein [Planctomycetaceae bacterium]